MEYFKKIKLKDGRDCILRNGTERDGQALLDIFISTHAETDYLRTYPDESTLTAEQEADFLREKTESPDSIEILAEVDGKVVATAGIEGFGPKVKTRHRCDFGISVGREYWGLGIGRALTLACIECAKKTGFSQVELEVVAENERAMNLYKSVGFVEYGRNPRGFRSRISGWQPLSLMLLDLEK
ncbi:MAG: GNAT family N-acetyltransferase [Lachnospiraceae bacterium]|nr:GNAT family N-acetyltransferase [Lachnospiraceae bacterium]